MKMMPWMERVFWWSLALAALFAIPILSQLVGVLPGGGKVIADNQMDSRPRPPIAGNITPTLEVRATGQAGNSAAGAVN